MSLQPGTVIQNYRLVRFLGDGGMGTVWLAEHTHLDRKVAIKCLHPQYARHEGIRARFKQEAATLAHLQHPGIVALHDYIEDESGAYLVLEYVDGRPLDDYLRNVSGPIPDPALRQMLAQILEGFVYAHGKLIVHRDIKPGNFLVTADGKVKILDFGIAKILTEQDRKLTKTGMNMGTVYYMSPEQVKGEPVDVRSDIYSLGVTLFQMATARCPYPEDTTEFYVYDQIVNHPLPAASDFYPGVSPGIEAIIAKATAKKLEDRFQDCSEFLTAIQNSESLGLAPSAAPEALEIKPETASSTPEIVPEVRVPSKEPQAEQPIEAPAIDSTEAPEAAPRKRRRGWIWGLLVLLLLGGGVATAWSLNLFPAITKRDDSLYVIASNLFLRSSPSMEASAKTKNMIPYGTKVKVRSRPKPGWAELERSGKPVFVAESYLADRATFLKLDHLCADDDARDALRESTHKLAILDYFERNGYHSDLSFEEYREVYGESRDPASIWYVSGEPKLNYFQSVLTEARLEKSMWAKEEKKNLAVVLVNKADSKNRLMVVFHFEGEGARSETIGVVDLSKCGGCLMRTATLGEVASMRFVEQDDYDAAASYLADGRECILLQSRGSATPWKRLVVWPNKDKVVIYPLY